MHFNHPMPDVEVLHCEAAIRHKPDHLPALDHLGKLYISQRRFADAAQIFVQISVLQPEDSVAYEYLADIYFEIGDYERCAGVLKILKDRKPNDVGVFMNLAIAYFYLGKRLICDYYLSKAYTYCDSDVIKSKIRDLQLKLSSI